MSLSKNAQDTVTMVKKEINKYGPWELQLSYGGEADLHRHFDTCKKNPGHRNFIPVDQFNVDHLPPDYHDNDLVGLVTAIADLTVRVSVKYVSDRRPATFPGSDTPYPYHSNKEEDFMMVGTGFVWRVDRYSSEGRTCNCKKCLNSGKPRTEFANIVIRTAAHVVYDETEGAHTTCDLFFDRGRTLDLCAGVVTLNGMSSLRSDAGADFSDMTYVTTDLDLINKLDKMVIRYNKMCAKINNKYNTGTEFNQERIMFPKRAPAPRSPITIIASHPHGCCKYISVGYTRVENEMLLNKYNLFYTTSTCTGSSGAHVWVVGERYLWYPFKTHSGNWDDSKKLNFSSYY